jgi:hypothetical protein
MSDTKDTVDKVKYTAKKVKSRIKSSMNSSNLVNLSIVTYVSFTFIFFVLKFRFFPANNYYWILLFLMISCLAQMIQNLQITASPELCGTSDFRMAFFATTVPWVLVFTVFTFLIIASPGWLRVFSNTFGVFAAEAYGIQGMIQACLKKPTSLAKGDYEYMKMVENIYSDRMPLVLELNLDDVTDISNNFVFPALNKLEEMNLIQSLKDAPPQEHENIIKARRELYNALLLKDNVGYFFWFLLIGIFCILVSTNTILSSNCSPKVGKSYDSIFKT